MTFFIFVVAFQPMLVPDWFHCRWWYALFTASASIFKRSFAFVLALTCTFHTKTHSSLGIRADDRRSFRTSGAEGLRRIVENSLSGNLADFFFFKSLHKVSQQSDVFEVHLICYIFVYCKSIMSTSGILILHENSIALLKKEILILW